MSAEALRRFNIVDGLIVTAATAITLALLKETPDHTLYVFMSGGLVHYGNAPFAVRVAMRASFALIPWSVAIFLMRLRRPRPPLNRLILQPGMAACGAATLWLGAKTLLLVLMMIGVPRKRSLVTAYMGDGVALVSWAAPAVAGAWLVLAISGNWNAERSWIDRLGRLVGVSWIAWEAGNSLRILF